MSTIHTSTRASLDLSVAAPSGVTTYTENISIDGSPVLQPTSITDGTDGADTITAPSGGNYVFGFGGNDRLIADGSNARLLGGAGNDIFEIGNNTLLAGFADGAILDFEVGSDQIDLSDFEVSSFDELTITSNSDGSFATVQNLEANLTIDVTSTGGLGGLTADSFIFSGSADSGSGGDTGTENESEDSSDGTDTGGESTAFSLPSFTLPTLAALEAASDGVSLNTGGSTDPLTGSDGGDLIEGGVGNIAEELFGAGGVDNILGNGGDDMIYGGSARVDTSDVGDFLYGGAGDDFIFGNGGDDVLMGGNGLSDTNTGDDQLMGGVGNDTLLGNDGNDTLFGQVGDDVLIGGLGDDVFVFGWESGSDLITSFDDGDVLRILAGVNGSGIETATDVLQALQFGEGGAIIDLGSGNEINILGLSSITQSQISVVDDLGLPG